MGSFATSTDNKRFSIDSKQKLIYQGLQIHISVWSSRKRWPK